MPEMVEVSVNGVKVEVVPGTTVAVAIMLSGAACRKSVTGEGRGPLCGMGICFECRAEINGLPHQRSCQILCSGGMKVKTDG